MAWALSILLVMVMIVVLGKCAADNFESYNSRSQMEESKKWNVPGQENIFIAQVSSFVNEYERAGNQLQKTTVAQKRAQALREAFANGYQVESWVGKLDGMFTSREGNAAITIKLLNSDIKLSTVCNLGGLSYLTGETVIPSQSDLFKTIAQMKEGNIIEFSGSFLPSDTYGLEACGITEATSMQAPEFQFKFTSVKLLSE